MKTNEIADKYGIDKAEFEDFIETNLLKHEKGFKYYCVDDEDVEQYVSDFKNLKMAEQNAMLDKTEDNIVNYETLVNATNAQSESNQNKTEYKTKLDDAEEKRIYYKTQTNTTKSESDDFDYDDKNVKGIRTASKLIFALNIVLGIGALVAICYIPSSGRYYGVPALYFLGGVAALVFFVIIGIAAYFFMNCIAEITENSNHKNRSKK